MKKKIKSIKSSTPIEFIDIKPDYFVGFTSTFFRFSNPKKKNLVLWPKKQKFAHIIVKEHINTIHRFNSKTKLVYV